MLHFCPPTWPMSNHTTSPPLTQRLLQCCGGLSIFAILYSFRFYSNTLNDDSDTLELVIPYLSVMSTVVTMVNCSFTSFQSIWQSEWGQVWLFFLGWCYCVNSEGKHLSLLLTRGKIGQYCVSLSILRSPDVDTCSQIHWRLENEQHDRRGLCSVSLLELCSSTIRRSLCILHRLVSLLGCKRSEFLGCATISCEVD